MFHFNNGFVLLFFNFSGSRKDSKRTDSLSFDKPEPPTKRENKRTDSVSEPPGKKEKKTEAATGEAAAAAPAKEKAEKAATKKQKKAEKAAETSAVKTKASKEVKDENDDLVKLEIPSNDTDLVPKLNKLKKLRDLNYGYTQTGDLDPEKEDYGIDMDSSGSIDFGLVVPDKDCRIALEFVLS